MTAQINQTDSAMPLAGPRHSALGAITLGAIALFVGTGSSVLATIMQRQIMGDVTVDRTLVIALILNIAIILFGWRRHQDFRREVMVRIAAEERARSLATGDPLTGLLSRRALAENGAALLHQAERRGKAAALMMVDLDHFRSINDLHGHAVGDTLLKLIGGAITAALPQQALVARLGGDTFAALLLFDAPHPETVERLATQLGQRLAEPWLVDGIQVQLGGSIGLARSDTETANIDTLMRSADIAATAAKKAGRNRYLWFDNSMALELQARNELETALKAAIPQGQIVPFFEQQIDLTTNRLMGFEVLARWQHPLRGLLTPEHFIPVAEECGLIGDLSLSVMRQAFLAAVDWHPNLTLTVNLAPSQLKDPWFAQKIVKLLAETGFPARRLEVDITEAALFDNLALAQTVAASLKNQGIRIALDDFGTGYSSIAHLRAIPWDRIKIDRSFVTTIQTSAESAAVVTAITRLADSLNLPVTAEGVEDEAIEGRMRALGCGLGQGYRYGRPISAINARKVLAERRLIEILPPREVEKPQLRQAG